VIQYSLSCRNGHSFDAWFANAAAFDSQQARGLVNCAICGIADVDKAVMAPAVARTDKGKVALGSVQPEAAQLREMLRQYRRKVMSEADYVGDRFADEARKIHFDEVEARGIYGEATRDEVVALAEEGIEFMPLPDLPEEHN
jgi:hypothetical protein